MKNHCVGEDSDAVARHVGTVLNILVERAEARSTFELFEGLPFDPAFVKKFGEVSVLFFESEEA